MNDQMMLRNENFRNDSLAIPAWAKAEKMEMSVAEEVLIRYPKETENKKYSFQAFLVKRFESLKKEREPKASFRVKIS